MDKYLLEILKDVNTIIIPGLGALTITNTDTGEIMFMPYLKHDDGKLSAYIAEKEGMDENEAKNLIAKYVREINTKLDQGDSYDMFQFGSFLKNDEGDIQFKNWDSAEGENEPATETEPKSTKEKKPIVEEKPVEQPKTEEPKKEDTPTSKKPTKKKPIEKKAEKKPAPVKKEKPVKKENEKSAEAPKKKEEKVVPVTPTPAKEDKKMNIAEKEELSKNVEKLATLKKHKDEGADRKKRGAGFYILISLIVIIVAGGTYVALNYDDMKQHIPFLAENEDDAEKKTEMDKMKETLGLTESGEGEDESVEESEETDDAVQMEEEVEEETPIEEEVIEEEPEPEIEENPKPQPEVNNSGKHYHIVAGAFSSADNAERLAQSLRDQGYPSTTFVRGSMTIVSLSAHASNADASAALKDAREVVPKGWVLHWK